MRVSVAMATYNGGKFLGQQLESLGRQTLLPCELVVCDDGSSDDTLEIISRFSAAAPFPVHLHRNETRLEYPNNFLKAAGLCRGDLIAYCDQDDVWLETKLQRCAAAFGDREVRLVIHSSEVTDEALRPVGRGFPHLPRSRVEGALRTDPWWVPPGFCLTFSAAMFHGVDYRRRPVTHLHDLGHAMPHDQWVYFLARACGRTVFLSDRMALYRQHGRNASGFQQRSAAWQVRAASEAGSSKYRALARLCGEYAQYFAALSHEALDFAGAFRVASGYYTCLRERYTLRADHYESRKGLRKPLEVARMLTRGVYSSTADGGLGARAFLKDAALAMLLR